MVLAVLLLAAPTALGAWRQGGMIEPDTPEDQGWMWTEADQQEGPGRMYFNAYAIPWRDTRTGFNVIQTYSPNEFLPGGRVAPAGSIAFEALLGVWKDCNRDGFIGLAYNAEATYPSDFLPSDTPCMGAPHLFQRSFGQLTHTYVREFLRLHRNPSLPYPPVDLDARVWGDFGEPGASPVFLCPTNKVSTTAVYSTGSALGTADCLMGYSAASTLRQVDPTDADKTDGKGGILSFDDPYHPERDCDGASLAGKDFHPLNHDLIWGSEASCDGQTNALEDSHGEAAFRVWDCSQTTPGTNHPGLRPEVMFLGERKPEEGPGSFYEGVNQTLEQEEPCRSPTWKNNFHFYLQYAQPRLWPAVEYLVDNPLENAPPRDPTLPKRASDFLLSDDGSAGNRFGAWRQVHPQSAHSAPSYRGGTFRSNSFDAAGPWWSTFYAMLGPVSLALYESPRSAEGRYGAEACPSSTGVSGGWDCNPEHWWDIDMGAPPTTVSLSKPRVGDSYHLRDVDCYDGRLYGEASSLAPEPARGAVPREAWDLVPDGKDPWAPKASLVAASTEGVCPSIPLNS